MLVNLDTGGGYREATQFAVRQMLNFATFELITQLMKPERYLDCRKKISHIHGLNENSRSARAIYEYELRLNEERKVEKNRAKSGLHQVALGSTLETSDENQAVLQNAGASSLNTDVSDVENSSPGSSQKAPSDMEGSSTDTANNVRAITNDKPSTTIYSDAEDIESNLEKKNRILNQ